MIDTLAVIDLGPEQHEAAEFIHAAMGLDYRLPDLNSPLLIVRKAVTNEDGEIVGVCLLRLCAETMLLLSPKLSPGEKMDAMEAMQPEVLLSAWRLGIDEVETRIPASVEEKFEKRLLQLGWLKDRSGWNPWSRDTK